MKEIFENESGEIAVEQDGNITRVIQDDKVVEYDNYNITVDSIDIYGEKITYDVSVIENLNTKEKRFFGFINGDIKFKYIGSLELIHEEKNKTFYINRESIKFFEDGLYQFTAKNDFEDVSEEIINRIEEDLKDV